MATSSVWSFWHIVLLFALRYIVGILREIATILLSLRMEGNFDETIKNPRGNSRIPWILLSIESCSVWDEVPEELSSCSIGILLISTYLELAASNLKLLRLSRDLAMLCFIWWCYGSGCLLLLTTQSSGTGLEFSRNKNMQATRVPCFHHQTYKWTAIDRCGVCIGLDTNPSTCQAFNSITWLCTTKAWCLQRRGMIQCDGSNTVADAST